MPQWWTDPVMRGVYADPVAHPPPPAPRNSNDYGARLARVEEHLNFRAWDQRRIEQESRFRARDLAQALMAVDTRLGSIEQEALTRQQVRQRMRNSLSLAAQLVRYGIAALFGLLLITGRASPETVKAVLGLLGFATG